MDLPPIDLYDPDRYVDGSPYAEFARLRRAQPVVWQTTPDGDGYWAVLSHPEVAAVSRQPDLHTSPSMVTASRRDSFV